MFRMEYATEKDISFWRTLDHHISDQELLRKIHEKRGYAIYDDKKPVGVLRYNLFWDLIPFLNLICFTEQYRGKGFGTRAMIDWEDEMRSSGHKLVMTSTMVEEGAQHFYRKLKYKDCGCLIKDFQPYVETMEMFMMKQL